MTRTRPTTDHVPALERRRLQRAGVFALVVFGLFLAIGCEEEAERPAFAARVGDQYLSVEELNASLGALTVGLDSVEARKQIIEQWITHELIAQEAIREGLQNDAEVLRLVAENERSVLVSALLGRYYASEDTEPTVADLEAYFAQHDAQFVLKEDYLRVRYLFAATAPAAEKARELLRDATAAGSADSLWGSIIDQYALDAEGSRYLSANYFPQSRLFPSATLREWTQRLNPDQIAPVIEEGGHFHVVQVVARRHAGTPPQMAWIEDELRERLIIDARKQMVARQVQRLRNEALAREDLEIH
jgi:hypothetical protein